MYLTTGEASALGELIHQLSEDRGELEVRRFTGQAVLRLLKADYYASFSWNAATGAFTDTVALNMGTDNLQAYEQYFQYRDPITPALQERRVPTLVTQIMPQRELMKTEFFNDFLARDGLHFGVNAYAYDGDRNIGDMRIWRGKKKENFDQNSLSILAIVQPAFTAAIKRARVSMQLPQPVTSGHAARAGGLSGREQVIAQYVCQGWCDKKIAQHLGIEFSTLRTHLARMFRKLDVHSRTQLVQCLAKQEHAH